MESFVWEKNSTDTPMDTQNTKFKTKLKENQNQNQNNIFDVD